MRAAFMGIVPPRSSGVVRANVHDAKREIRRLAADGTAPDYGTIVIGSSPENEGRDTTVNDSADAPWRHDHTFRQDEKKPGEMRTLLVVVLTALTMGLEIGAGFVFHSMALLADGLHMASHALALTISLAAYVYARRHARSERFCFGTGKVNSLAGFAGAILLAVFSLMMVWESVQRLLFPVDIAFNQAIVVAIVGLIVNGVSVVILGHEGWEKPEVAASETADTDSSFSHDHPHDHDHNLRSAYLHVLADTLTSVLAITALLAGKYLGLSWLDPVMGLVGAFWVSKWSIGLLGTTGKVLLDFQAPLELQQAIREAIEQQGDEVADLHLWAVAPGAYCLILSIVSDQPRTNKVYRESLPTNVRLAHVTIEIWDRNDGAAAPEDRA